jgi:hypothetical protein
MVLSPKFVFFFHIQFRHFELDYQNPLHFSFPPEVDAERLMQGAEQLSDAVLRSGEALVSMIHNISNSDS